MIKVKNIGEKIYKDIDEIKDIALKFDIQVKTYDEASKKHFESLPLKDQMTIQHNLGQYLQLLKHTVPENPHQKVTNADFFKSVLSYFDYEVDPTFFEHLQENQTIEIYNTSNIQLFRNFNYFELSSYSLLHLISFQWFELFERDPKITEKILTGGREVLASQQKTKKWNIPKHELKEILLGDTPKTLVVENGTITPVFQKSDNKIIGVVNTLTVHSGSELKEAI